MTLTRRHALGGLAALPVWPAALQAAPDARPTGPAPVDVSRLPAPGSYRLAQLGRAPDGTVLDVRGQPQRLHALLAGRASVVSFMYTYCRDPLGCPRAWAAMEALHAALVADRRLAAGAQLISLSFDPANDTPDKMALFAGERAGDARVRWHFLTTASVRALLPVLAGFGQDVSVESGPDGQPVRTLNHLLKVFLVDARLQLREIYGVATLAPEAVLVDLRTLALERR